jgi:hypothetical protein
VLLSAARLGRAVLGADADLPVVFDDGELHVGDRGTACRSERRLQLMVRDLLAPHHGAVDVAVVDQKLRRALDQGLEPLALVGGVAQRPVERDQRQHPTCLLPLIRRITIRKT